MWALGASFDWAKDHGESSTDQMGPAASSLILALNPRSRDGVYFQNNAALTIEAPTSSSVAAGSVATPCGAMLSVGSHAYVTHTVRDSAQCLGGVQLLFPLLARLPGAASTEAAASGAGGDDAADGKSGGDGGFSGSSTPLRAEQLLVQLLGLMSQMLWDSTADQHFMLRRHGFAIFVFLLRQLPPVLWTVQAVTACVQLTSCFSSIEALHHEAVWLLFGAPRLWIFTALEVWPARRQRSSALPASPAARPPTRARPSRRAPVAAHAGAQVQLEVYEVLQTVIGLKPRAFLAPTSGTSEPLLTIQALLDMLEVFYWRQPSAASFARQPLRHAISGDVIGERPGIDGLRRLRKKVMLLLQVRADAPARWTPRGAHHTIPPSHHPPFSSIPSHHPHSHRGLHMAPITPCPLATARPRPRRADFVRVTSHFLLSQHHPLFVPAGAG